MILNKRCLTDIKAGCKAKEKDMKNNSGFTLIELMIVISIISILATMAVPSFQDQIIRTQVKESYQLCQFMMDSIETYYKEKATFPRNNDAAGLPGQDKIVGNYVEKVSVSKGTIHITLGNRVNKHVSGKVISIRPAIVKDEPLVPIAWVYGYASVPKGMTVMDTNQSDIKPRFLPVNSRY
jgi:type IV pilus assembly protein PilA